MILKQQASELQASRESLEAKIAQAEEFRERCETLKHDRKHLLKELLNSKEEVSSLQFQLDKEQRERENVSDEISEAKRKIKRREDEIVCHEERLVEQGDVIEKGNRRSREEQGQLRIVRQERDIQVQFKSVLCRRV